MWCLKALLDLAGIYRTWNSKYNNWSVFGQDHVARVLLKYPEAQTHDAVGDALKSIRLYHLSRQLQQDPAVWQQAQVKLGLNSLFLTSWLLSSILSHQLLDDHVSHMPVARQWVCDSLPCGSLQPLLMLFLII